MKVDSLEYRRIHREIHKHRGSAKDHACIDCGNHGYDWSYEHNTDPYNIYNYDPRCKSCHTKYDMTSEWAAKSAVARKGVKRSIEARNKMAEAKRRYWANQSEEKKQNHMKMLTDIKYGRTQC